MVLDAEMGVELADEIPVCVVTEEVELKESSVGRAARGKELAHKENLGTGRIYALDVQAVWKNLELGRKMRTCYKSRKCS